MGTPSGINQSGFPIPPFQGSDLFLRELGGLFIVLFSLFTPRHKLQALYPDGKLVVYTEQELMTKPPRLCQPTEAATVRRIRKGETSPLRRLLLLAFWRSKRLTRRVGAEPRKKNSSP